MPIKLKSRTARGQGQEETRLWLHILSLHGDIFSSLNSAMNAEAGLSLAKFDVLAQLDRYRGGLALGQLSAQLKVSGSNVTGLVKRLLADKLISKTMSSEDRRSFIVTLTPKGEAAFRAASEVHARHLKQRLRNLRADELEAAIAFLRSLAATIHEAKP